MRNAGWPVMERVSLGGSEAVQKTISEQPRQERELLRQPDSHGGAGYWEVDQRFCVMDTAFMHDRTNVGD